MDSYQNCPFLHVTFRAYRHLTTTTLLLLPTPLADHEAQGTRGVISMSIGGGGPDSLWDAACEAAHDDGMVRHACVTPTSSMPQTPDRI